MDRVMNQIILRGKVRRVNPKSIGIIVALWHMTPEVQSRGGMVTGQQ